MSRISTQIFFVLGVDGSGKSSHGEALSSYLQSTGKKVKYVWIRRVAYFSLPLLGLSRILGITKVRRFKNGAHWLSEYPFYLYRPLQFLWPLLQFLDTNLRTFFSVTLPLWSDKNLVIIIDRGLIDALVDVTIDIGTPREYHFIENLYISSIQKTSFVCLFDVDENTAMKRKKDIPNKSYLTGRRALYLALSKRYKWHVYSTQNDFMQVHNQLISDIEGFVPGQ